MKYRKRPVVVDAAQFDPAVGHPAVKETAPERGSLDRRYVVQTAGGTAFLWPGDWIIAEPDGRGYYPCKPDIFAATYEPVEPT